MNFAERGAPDANGVCAARRAPERTSVKALLTATAVCFSLAGCSPQATAPRPAIPDVRIEGTSVIFPKDSPQLATLKVAEAHPERASFVRINGRITWDESRTSRVGSALVGRVAEILRAPGDRVRRGEVLAVLSSPEFGMTQSEARRSETDLRQAERTLARARELHDAGVIPAKEMQLAEADAERARAERERTAARERLHGGAGVIDQRFRIVAPIDGVVVMRNLTPGQEVRPEQGDPPLFVISDPARLWIALDVPETLSQEVAVGEAVRISVPALPSEIFEAHVEYVADFLDPQTRMIKARAAVSNPARRLKAEMFATADVEIPPSKALRVPSSALFLQGDVYYGFVEESTGRFVRRAVRAEEAPLGTMRVLGGLRPGERIVSEGALLLQQLLNQRAAAAGKDASVSRQQEP